MPSPPPTPAATPRRGGHARLALKIVVGLAVAAAFSWLFLRGSDIRSVSLAIAAARPGLLTLALASAGIGFWVRALRWRRYLRPVKVVSLKNCFEISLKQSSNNLIWIEFGVHLNNRAIIDACAALVALAQRGEVKYFFEGLKIGVL